MKCQDTITVEEKVAHCSGFPLRAVLTFKGCQIKTGKLFTEAVLAWKSCTIQYYKDEEVPANVTLPEITQCPNCASHLPKGPKA